MGCSFYNYVLLDIQYTNMNSKSSICYLQSTITSRKQTFMMYAGSINGALPAPVPGPPVVTKTTPDASSGKALCQPYSINWYFTGVGMKDVFMDSGEPGPCCEVCAMIPGCKGYNIYKYGFVGRCVRMDVDEFSLFSARILTA